jgi:hypothetical protein
MSGTPGETVVMYEARKTFYQPAPPSMEAVIYCLTDDALEDNDTRNTAVVMNTDPGGDGVQDLPNTGDVVIYPAGDDDWYRWGTLVASTGTSSARRAQS